MIFLSLQFELIAINLKTAQVHLSLSTMQKGAVREGFYGTWMTRETVMSCHGRTIIYLTEVLQYHGLPWVFTNVFWLLIYSRYIVACC